MFVVMHKGKVRRIIFIFTAVFLLLSVVMFGTVCVPQKTAQCGEITYTTELKENSVDGFASQFQIQTGEMYCEKTVTIPEFFNKTYCRYNELQRLQGLDLEKYKGKQCTLFVYEISDFTADYEKAYLTLLIYKDFVIGGHISTLTQSEELYTFFGEKYGEI